MRVAVVGNCQVVGLASALSMMLPRSEIDPLQVHVIPPHERAAAAQRMERSDLIVTQPLSEAFGTLSTSRWLEGSIPVVQVPNIFFEGFHPDVTYVGDMAGRLLGPMGPYHSYLVIRGAVQGLTTGEVLESFFSGTMEALGYHQRWDESVSHLESRGRDVGFPVSTILQGWASRQPFMMTFNHPTVSMLAHVAEVALGLAGVEPQVSGQWAAIANPSDLTSAPVWPWYPTLAGARGLPEFGSWVFKPERGKAVMGLEEFVAASLDAYRALPPTALAPRNGSVRRDFDALLAAAATPVSPGQRQLGPPLSQTRGSSASAREMFSRALRDAVAAGPTEGARASAAALGLERRVLSEPEARRLEVYGDLPDRILDSLDWVDSRVLAPPEAQEVWPPGVRAIGPTTHVGGPAVITASSVGPARFRAAQLLMVDDADLWAAGHQTQVWAGDGRLAGVGLAGTRYLRQHIERVEPIHLAGTTLDISVPGGGLFSHWLMDSLPKVGVVQAAGHAVQSIDHIVVNRLRSPLHREALALLGVRPEQIVELDGGGRRFVCDRLLTVTPVRTSWVGSDQLYEWVRGLAGASDVLPERVMLVRGEGTRRRVSNQEQVVSALARRGYVTVDPAQLGLAGGLAALRSARVVVGGHGAGLANIVTAVGLRALVELHGPHCATEFLSTASVLGAAHFTVGGESKAIGTPGDQTRISEFLVRNASDYAVDVDLVMEAVLRAEEVLG